MKAVAGVLLGDVGPPAKNLRFGRSDSSKAALMQYVGIDWGTRRAAWCALNPDCAAGCVM